MKAFGRLQVVLALLGSIGTGLFGCGTLRADVPDVLVLHAYHQGFVWSDRITEAVETTLSEALGKVNLHVAYLDAHHVDPADAHHAARLRDLLEARYLDRGLDAILAVDDSALDFLVLYGSNLVAETPVVFCGINDYRDTRLAALGTNHTGVVELPDVADTLSLAARLHPQARRVVVLGDATPTARAIRRQVEKAAMLFGGLSFTYLDAATLTTQEMLARVEQIPPDSIVLATLWTRDRTGRHVSSDQLYSHICALSQAPVYALCDSWMGEGVVGGKLVTAAGQGEQAAQMIVRIIRDGMAPGQIPVEVGSLGSYQFDWRALERFGIPAHQLPAGALILHRAHWTPRQYLHNRLIRIGSLVIMAILLVTLIHSVLARRRAEADEARLSAVVEATEEVIATGRPGHSLTYLNSAGKRLFGIEEVPVPWERVLATYMPDSLLVFQRDAMGSVLRDGSWTGEVEMIRADGEPFPAQQTLIAHWSTGGQLAYLSTVIRDVTEQKRVERELRHRERDLRVTLESIGDAVVATDEKGIITRVNKVACALTGCPADEAVGQDISDVFRLVDSSTRDVIESPVLRTMREGRTVTIAGDNLLLSRDGRELRIADSAAPIRGRDGTMQGAVIVFRDVTDEFVMQERLQHAQKLEAVGLLAGGVAHDFNNLLTGILGNAELLARQAETEESRKRIGEIVRAGERAADMTRQLLAFSRKGKYQNVPIDLHDVLSDVGALVTHAVDRHVKVVCAFDAPSAVVEGDPSQLHSAFLNMGVNARDAMPDGGILRLGTRVVAIGPGGTDTGTERMKPGKYVEVQISDTGMGMSRETLSRIFEPFFTTKQPGEGTGLGLAGVYGCVEAHGGSIQVESEPGIGTTFTIQLPCAPDQESPLGREPEQGFVSGEGEILVIDDEEIVREVLRAGLMGMGYRVTLCENGEDGVAWFQAHHQELALVILDLVMPGLDGRAVFAQLRKIDPSVPVLIASGYTDNRRISELITAGAAGSLAKPFPMDNLSQMVSRCIRRRRM